MPEEFLAYAEKVLNDNTQAAQLLDEVRGRTLEEIEAETKIILGVSISQNEGSEDEESKLQKLEKVENEFIAHV